MFRRRPLRGSWAPSRLCLVHPHPTSRRPPFAVMTPPHISLSLSLLPKPRLSEVGRGRAEVLSRPDTRSRRAKPSYRRRGKTGGAEEAFASVSWPLRGVVWKSGVLTLHRFLNDDS